jgi:hypothetical protein
MSMEHLIEAAGDPDALIALAPDLNGSVDLSDRYMVKASELGCMDMAAKAALAAGREARRAEEEVQVPRVRPAAEDPLLAPAGREEIMLRLMREDRPFEDYIAALRAEGEANVEVMIADGSLRMEWDAQAPTELLSELGPRPAWNGDGLDIPADLDSASRKMAEVMPEPTVEGAAFGASAGLGKTRARLEAIQRDTVERRRKAGGKLLAPSRDRKQAAHAYAVPTALLAEDVKRRAEELGLSVYFIRGRGLEDPEMRGMMDESKSRLMCWKDRIRDTAATASSDQKSDMCGTREAPCSALGLCHYSTQADEIRAMNPDLIIVTHAALRTRPLAGAAIPEILSLTIDEEFAIDSMLTTTSRRFGENAPLRLSALDLDVVSLLIRDRALAAAKRKLAKLADAGDEDALSAAERAVRTAKEAIGTVTALRDVVLQCRYDGGVDFGLVQNAFGMIATSTLRVKRAERLVRVLLACKREVFAPKDWKDSDDRKGIAQANWMLMTARDLVEHVIIPALDKDRPGMVPAVRFEMVPVQSKSREKTYAPFLAFAFTHGIAAPFRDVPTLLMDATIDTRFLVKLFPNLVTSEYAACPKDPGARIVLVPEGYGKSSILTKTGALSRKSEGLRLLFRGLQMAVGDRGAGFISHKDTVMMFRNEEDADDPLIGWHGNIRGVDSWNGVAALLVAGASTPPPRASELATEALLGRVVDREPEVEGSPWGGGFRRAEVAVQQRRSTVSWHRDPDVAAYMHQVVTAGIAQAAARARFVRNPVLLIIVGLALDHLPPGSATVKEWKEVEPDDVDRMLIERRIAFGRSAGRKLFPW